MTAKKKSWIQWIIDLKITDIELFMWYFDNYVFIDDTGILAAVEGYT